MYVPAASVPLGMYVVAQEPAALSVQVEGLKPPSAPPVIPKVTTPPVTAPPDPLSVAVTTMAAVDRYELETELTAVREGAMVEVVSVLEPAAGE